MTCQYAAPWAGMKSRHELDSLDLEVGDCEATEHTEVVEQSTRFTLSVGLNVIQEGVARNGLIKVRKTIRLYQYDIVVQPNCKEQNTHGYQDAEFGHDPSDGTGSKVHLPLEGVSEKQEAWVMVQRMSLVCPGFPGPLPQS